jgi:hypothetical protein
VVVSVVAYGEMHVDHWEERRSELFFTVRLNEKAQSKVMFIKRNAFKNGATIFVGGFLSKAIETAQAIKFYNDICSGMPVSGVQYMATEFVHK